MIRTGFWVKCLLSTTEGSAKTSPTQCRLRNVEWSHEHRRLRSPESLRSSNLGRDHLPPMRQKATLKLPLRCHTYAEALLPPQSSGPRKPSLRLKR